MSELCYTNKLALNYLEVHRDPRAALTGLILDLLVQIKQTGRTLTEV